MYLSFSFWETKVSSKNTVRERPGPKEILLWHFARLHCVLSVFKKQFLLKREKNISTLLHCCLEDVVYVNLAKSKTIGNKMQGLTLVRTSFCRRSKWFWCEAN